MRTRNRVVAVVLAGIPALASAACSGGKKKISAEEFREKMEDKSYVVTEAAANGAVKVSYTAYPNEHAKWLTVTYSEFESADDAKMSYTTSRHSFEKAKSTGDYTNVMTGSNKFTAEKGTEMTVITVLVEDVVIMAYGSDKTMVQDAIEALGY